MHHVTCVKYHLYHYQDSQANCGGPVGWAGKPMVLRTQKWAPEQGNIYTCCADLVEENQTKSVLLFCFKSPATGR
jgi:hypothetical protein